jgi:hypothetical protein
MTTEAKPWEKPEEPQLEQSSSPRAEGASEDTESGEGGPAIDPSETEQSEVDGGDAGSDEISALEEELREEESLLAELSVVQDEVTRRRDESNQKADDIRARIEKLKPKNGTTAVIQQYLASQKKLLADRGARRLALADAGIDLKELAKSVNKSPLDQSMARKTARGGRRPPPRA